MRSTEPLMPLTVRGLKLALGGRRILDGIDLRLGARGCTVIMGQNGAGKSVLLRVLHGLSLPDTGVVSWNGRSPAETRLRQSLVTQRPVLLRRSVAANVDFVLRAHGLPAERRDEVLDLVGLAEAGRRPARRLSGGEQQRLSLARALATSPDVLMMDEPTAHLDPASIVQIERLVMKARQDGIRILFVTHDAGQARRLADDVVFLHRGRVAEHAPADRFFPRPHSNPARAYLDGEVVP